ncbi:MAG: hypothetical protein JWM34_305 [Ilumatobacteraceae bacterium]|nr:hypothetical protein [Ilumatobacteraceae bacterium]
MKPRKPKIRPVLVDESFVDALLAVDSPSHAAALEIYRTLVDRYQTGADRLFALSTVLGDVPPEFRRTALAPLLRLNVARQHRSAARRMTPQADPAVALALVMMRREKIRTVATASTAFDGLDLTILSTLGPATQVAPVVPVPVVAGPDAPVADPVSELELSARTGSTSAPQSTDE